MNAEAAKEEPWTIAKALRWTTDDFRGRGFDSARLDAELLLGHVLELDRVRLILESQRPLSGEELAQFRKLIVRRRAEEPIAYILGSREFFGHSFVVGPSVLIPRPDTEALVEVALHRSQERYMYGRALDLCTGSGCVAISFARARRTWSVCASDVSAQALAVARENALRLGVVRQVGLFEGDLFAPFAGARPFDLITANPPYIPSADIRELSAGIRKFEPTLALDGGPRGLTLIERIVREAPRHLVDGGVLAMEVQSDQADAVSALFEQHGFGELQRRRDYGGHERVVSGAWRAQDAQGPA